MAPLLPHEGLPGSQVIPTGWTAAHAPVVTRTLDCTITIGPAGQTPTFNPDSGQTETSTAIPAYDGPASVALAAASGTGRVDAADELVDKRTYEIKLPAGTTADVQPDQVVHVTASPDDVLTGALLTVANVEHPAREFSRVLLAIRFD